MIKITKKENRHKRNKSVQYRTDRLPIISFGTRENKLLLYFYNNRGQFNVRRYSINNNLSRSTLYDVLSRLIAKGLVKHPSMGSYYISGKGIEFVESKNQNLDKKVSKRLPLGVSETNTLSTHYTRYILPIKSLKKFSENYLKNLNPLRYKTIQLPNMKQHLIYFEDATIIISLRQIAIRIHDILADDTEEAHFQLLSKALKFEELIRKELQIETEGIYLEQSHYARVNSILADSLKKIDEHYFIEFKDGTKFWIDQSPPNKIEDETNSQEVRKKVDNFMQDLVASNSKFSDIDKIKEVTGNLSKISYNNLVELAEIKRNMIETTKDITEGKIYTQSLSTSLEAVSQQLNLTNKIQKTILGLLGFKNKNLDRKNINKKYEDNYIG